MATLARKFGRLVLMGCCLGLIMSCAANAGTAPVPASSAAAQSGSHAQYPEPAELPTAHHSTVDSQGRLVIDGQPFFPLGFYQVSYDASDEVRIENMQTIAAAGFNLLHEPLDTDDRALLDTAAELGLLVIAEYNAPMFNVIAAYREHPTIIAWNIADDVDDGRLSVADVDARRIQTRAIDPSRITYISGFSRQSTDFAASADVLGFQTYPIGNGGLTLDYVGDILTDLRATLGPAHPLIANLQTFAWPGERAPTPQEVRNMTYQALVSGVDGIIYYTYLDDAWNMRNYSDIWATLQELAAELNMLTPMLLEGQRSRLNTGNLAVMAGYWQHNDTGYLILVNTAYEAHNVDVALPETAPGSATPLVAQPASELHLTNGHIQGMLAAEGVVVYHIR